MDASAKDLERIQSWFYAAITHPGGSREGLDSDRAKQFLPADDCCVDDIVLPSNALNSIERLSIYANMYFDRLIDILAEEFPTVRHLLGAQDFAEVVKDFVTRHPSTHYSLARLGREFPRFLRDECDGFTIAHREFAAAIATVERTMEDVFDEHQVEPLLLEELQAIEPQSWDRVRLKTVSALRLLQLTYPVNDYISAVRDTRSIDIPAAKRSYVVVYRLRYRVWRMDLDEFQFTLLSALHEERTLGEALRACAELPGGNPAALASSVHEWFRNWTAEGFFHKIEIA